MAARLLIVIVIAFALVAPRAEDSDAQPARGRPEPVWTVVAKTAMAAVVNVASSKTVRAAGSESPFLSDPFFRFFFDAPQPAPRRERSLGSGVLISADGYVLTNNHVIDGAQDIRVALGDRREFRAKLVGTDPRTDVAVLRLPGRDFPATPLGNSDDVEIAETVLAIGNPFGLGQTVTMGIVSAIGRANVGIADYEDFIQTDAAINPGNSGGALVNGRGELIGINTAIFSKTGGYQGIGFAVPVNMARVVMDQIVRHGRVTRGSIGVVVQDVTPAMARGLGLPDLRGVVIGDIAAGSPAARVGLQRGELILRVGDRATDDSGHFRNLIAGLAPGTQARLTVRRGHREQTIDVEVIEQIERRPRAVSQAENARPDPLGMSITDITPDIARQLGLPRTTQGVVVAEVRRGGLAQETGLRVGDVILEINRQAIQSSRDVKRAFDAAPNKDLVLLVSRGGATAFFVIERGGA